MPPFTTVESGIITVAGASISGVAAVGIVDSDIPAGVMIGPARIPTTDGIVFRFANVTAATIAAATVGLRVALLNP